MKIKYTPIKSKPIPAIHKRIYRAICFQNINPKRAILTQVEPISTNNIPHAEYLL
jgi:hypothetical protein